MVSVKTHITLLAHYLITSFCYDNDFKIFISQPDCSPLLYCPVFLTYYIILEYPDVSFHFLTYSKTDLSFYPFFYFFTHFRLAKPHNSPICVSKILVP